jgi:sugar lactone lactonase YvrE
MGLREGALQAAMLATAVVLALPASAGAYSTAPGYQASDYATGFPESAANDWGPIGIAFDQSDNMYVADRADGNIYRFQPGGGTASGATRLTASPIPGLVTGLVVSASGDIYVARYGAGDIVQVDPGSGEVIRTVASIPCATGVAIDPASGDLFVSQNLCGSTIFRVSNYASGPGTVSAYTNAPGVDGLAFDNVSGSLYAESNGHVLRIDGTQSPTPGHVDSVAKVPYADGLAFGEHSSGEPAYLVANRNNGTATRVDFRLGLVPSQQDIFTGGSRGDFAAVDSHGCLYITQSASVIRIAGSDQSCGLEPTTQGPAPRAAVAVHADVSPRGAGGGTKACVKVASVRLRVSQQGRVRVRSATVYVNGRRVKQLRGAAVTAPFVLSHLPRSSFTIKVVALTTSGRKLVSSKHYGNCAVPPTRKCDAPVQMAVPQRRGARAVMLGVSVGGRHTRTVRGHSVKRVTLTNPPRSQFTAKLITHYTRGRNATTSRTFPACSP